MKKDEVSLKLGSTTIFFYPLLEPFRFKGVDTVTNFDERQCHKWAHLLVERQGKLNQALAAIKNQDYDSARKLTSQIFNGSYGIQVDPGMSGSLLYHMAMVTKMETETRVILDELDVDLPNIANQIGQIYGDFEADAKELLKEMFNVSKNEVVTSKRLNTQEKIALYTKLKTEQKNVEAKLRTKDPKAAETLQKLFDQWATKVTQMRLTQEYETIKGLLVTEKLAKTIGIPKLEAAMVRVQDKFGQETVNIALEVTLNVGMRREKLQSVMLSDHFISMTMSNETLDGNMDFLNCPIYGGHKYAAEKYGVDCKVSSLFCTHFCFAHAKAMLDTVLPFPFTLWQPKLIAADGKCEYYLKLAYSPAAQISERFVPIVMSWNVTRECNMKCSHCYINATEEKLYNELSTQEGKELIDQICQVSKPLLILSGGEPLLRSDIYELISYGASKGVKIGLGSNGSLIDDVVAAKLKAAGIATVSISLDSIFQSNTTSSEVSGVHGKKQSTPASR